MIADINKDISESNLISFADDTRIYTKIHDVSDCNLLQHDLNHIYDWATTNNMFFNVQKFHYLFIYFIDFIHIMVYNAHNY